MKQRVLTGWNLRRVAYLLVGLAIMANAIMVQEWWGLLLGGYFASMGIFAFGCAGGACSGDVCDTTKPDRNQNFVVKNED